MRTPAAVTLCALVLLGAAAPAIAQDAPYSDWNPAYAGFPTNAARDPTADCLDGSRICIDRTIEEMYRRFHTVVPVCDHNAVFSLTYIRVTEDIRRGIDESFYPDRWWINYLDAIFARIYFIAYDNWAAGRRALVPPAWRVAFDSARGRQVAGIGNLLLSMNGHINRDFPFLLYHAGLVTPDGRTRKPEHDSGNPRLRALYRPMLTELSHRFDETIDDYDAPGTEYDDETIFQILVGWREMAWRNAERLASAGSDSARQSVARDIEQQAEAQAQLIYANTVYRPGESSAARDARCARFGGQDPSYRRARRLAGGTARPVLPRRGLRMSRRGTVPLTLSCPAGGGDCSGSVTLRARRKRIGSNGFELSPGQRQIVAVELKRAARAALRTRSRLLVRVAVRSLVVPGRTSTVTRTAPLRSPPPRR